MENVVLYLLAVHSSSQRQSSNQIHYVVKKHLLTVFFQCLLGRKSITKALLSFLFFSLSPTRQISVYIPLSLTLDCNSFIFFLLPPDYNKLIILKRLAPQSLQLLNCSICSIINISQSMINKQNIKKLWVIQYIHKT